MSALGRQRHARRVASTTRYGDAHPSDHVFRTYYVQRLGCIKAPRNLNDMEKETSSPPDTQNVAQAKIDGRDVEDDPARRMNW
jgi:hypothetical protein